jgi:hypothetical protein
MFRHMVAILRGCECLISYPSVALCKGHVQIMTRPVWPVVAECVRVYSGFSSCGLVFLHTLLQDARFNHQEVLNICLHQEMKGCTLKF